MKTHTCWKNVISFVLALVFLCAACPAARAAGGVEYEFALAVHSISGDKYIRHVGPDASKDILGNDEYYAVYLTIHNNSGQALQFNKSVMMIDKTAFPFGKGTVENGGALSLYLDYSNVKKITPGWHTFELKLDGKQVFSTRFRMPRNWGSLMTLPTAEQQRSAGSDIAPYIAFYPEFGDRGGFTEYSIDLRMDFRPDYTYISPISWWLDTSVLEERYGKVWSDYGGTGGGYCGFQIWDDGTAAVIMTVWDVFYQDNAGNTHQVKAKVTYPHDAKDTSFDNSSEGSFVHYLYPFEWETGKEYRLLLQLERGLGGTAVLTLWIKDLEKNVWEKLFAFDTGLDDVWISSASGFVENYGRRTAASPRSIEFWNIRACMKRSGKWVNARSVTFEPDAAVGGAHHPGSYSFGQDNASCWIITSGVEGLCAAPKKKGPFKVPSTEKGEPY